MVLDEEPTCSLGELTPLGVFFESSLNFEAGLSWLGAAGGP